MIPLKWSLIQLQKYRGKDLLIDEVVQIDDLSNMDDIRSVSPIHVKGRADIESAMITFHLHITGHFILPCSRTLVDVKYPINIQTTETFLLNDQGFETDEDVYKVQGDVVDLMPAIKELLVLEVPMQVFSEDGQSDVDAAPQSGQGWEVIQEVNQADKIDPRLAKLAKFFNQNNSSSDN